MLARLDKPSEEQGSSRKNSYLFASFMRITEFSHNIRRPSIAIESEASMPARLEPHTGSTSSCAVATSKPSLLKGLSLALCIGLIA